MTCTKTLAKGRGGCWVRNWTDAGDQADGKPDLGTVTMAISEDGFTQFFAFAPGGKLSTKAVLDSEGAKHVPRLCTPCHGGQYLGAASNGDLGSIFREFEPSLFELAPGADEDDAARNWFALNQAVASANRALRREADGGRPGIDHAADATNAYVEAMYPTTADPPRALSVSDDAHVPPSWRQGANATIRAAQKALWKAVVNPTCMGCHRTNTVDFSQLSDFLQLGPTPGSQALLRTYLEMGEDDAKGPIAVMPQSELLFQNLHANQDALEAIERWLDAEGE
jgi:hypothetical protein